MPKKQRADHTWAKTAYTKAKKIIYASQSVCGICGRPVDFDKKFPDPWSATLDHIIPVQKGGDPFLMVGRNFGRTINNRRAKFEDSLICKDLENHLVTDSVGISLCDSYANFLFFHIFSLFRYNVISMFRYFDVLLFCCRQQTARGEDILSTRGSDGGGDAMMGQIVAQRLHT